MKTLRQRTVLQPTESLMTSANYGTQDEQDAYVVDDRAALRPSDQVQSKLLTLMPAMAVPVSCLHTHRDTRRVASR